MSLHGADAAIGDLPARVTDYITRRTAGTALGRTASAGALDALMQGAITADGLGIDRAWDLLLRAVDANTVALDGPRYLAFIPMSPGSASIWIDALVGAASYSAESWLEAAGAVAAENQALEVIRKWAGMPEGSGGCFTFGGSNGNLSALAVARDVAATRDPARNVAVVADTAHASLDNALRLLGMRSLVVPTAADGRFTGDALAAALDADAEAAARVAVVIASAGSTNAGIIDDLESLAKVAHRHDAWLHVDGAYGGGALLLDDHRHLFCGLGEADSFIVDPHKWFFSTAGSCAVIYRRPQLARATHTQHGPYIDVLHTDEPAWNPSDHAFQLTRRASGLPFWFTLVLHGTDALAEAVRASIVTTQYAVERLRATPGVELVLEPELTVVLFRKAGWDREHWRAWAADLLERQIAFVAPTTWKGETVGRLVFLHPLTTTEIVDEVIATLS